MPVIASPRIVRIPYTSVRNGNRFFEPRGRMLAAGFEAKPLGPDNEVARREAMRLYEAWLLVRDGREAPPPSPAAPKTPEERCLAKRYPKGSIGEAWQRFVLTDQWSQGKSLSNRTKIWWPAWRLRIEPIFADRNPNTIRFEELDAWRRTVVETSGLDAAHKATKVWRSFWGVLQAMRYTQLSDPSLEVKNTAPRPRNVRHSYASAILLAKTAWRRGERGLACIIITIWDTGFQPGDVRTAKAKHLGRDPSSGRIILDRSEDGREKSGAPVIGTLSRLGHAMVSTYLREMGLDLHDEAPLFRTRRGNPYRDTTLSHDFADLRADLDPTDKRQMRDMRRTATTEAFQGGANPAAISQKFGNTIERSNVLFRTYNPVDLAQVREADKARAKGRRANRT